MHGQHFRRVARHPLANRRRHTGKRRGYGFVEMPEREAKAAVAALNETEYLQRTLKVREANDKRDHQDGETSFTEN